MPLDWKILAASVVALLFISTIFIGGFGIGDFFSGIFNKVGDFLGGSPLTGLAAKKSDSKGQISILLSPKEISVTPDSEANVRWENNFLKGFKGEIVIYFSNKTFELKSPPSSLSSPLGILTIDPLSLKTLSVKNTKFEIKPDISTDSGSLNIEGFAGIATATEKGLLLEGTVSKLKVAIGSLNFELV